jgi:Tfp pilus assembly protein FimT
MLPFSTDLHQRIESVRMGWMERMMILQHSRIGFRRAIGRARKAGGFSTLELVVVIAIALVLGGIAVPATQKTLQYLTLRSAVSSLTGAIQATRYQAIFHGCRYQLAVSHTNYNYQISSEAPASGGTACTTTFANVGTTIPLEGNGVTLNQDVTLQFRPGGYVSATTGSLTTIVLTYGTLPSETISVSNYGDITVTP